MFQEEKLKQIKAANAAYELGMKEYEYVHTYVYDDIMIHLGMDDYGQSYFIMFKLNNEIKELGCGTYNFDYLDCIYYVLENMYKV